MALNIGELTGYLDLEAGGFEDTLGSAFDKLKEFGPKGAQIATAGGIAIGLAMGASVLKSMDVEAANDKLAAQLGLTQDESQRIGGIAGDLYANAYGESLDQVNEAIKGVVQNVDGMKTASSKDLESVTASVLDVATAFDQDLGMTTAAVGQLIRTGLAKNAKDALDIITVGLQSNANKADDLLETYNEYGTQFRKLGLTGAEATGLLSQGLKAGARDADIVADALKEFAIRTQEALETTDAQGKVHMTALGTAMNSVLPASVDMYEAQEAIAKGGKGAADTLDLMLDGLRNIKDPTFQAQSAVALFGTQAEDMGAALYSLDLTTAADGIGQVGGAAQRMGATLNDNAKTNIEAFKRQVQAAFVDFLGDKALPVVNEMARVLATVLGPAIRSVSGFLSDHTTTAQLLAVVIGAIVVPALAAWGVASTVNAAKSVAAWLVTAATARTSGAAQELSAAQVAVSWVIMGAQALANGARMAAGWLLAMGPIGLVIAAVVAVGVALVALWQRSQTFRDIVNGVWSAVSAAAQAMWNNVLKPTFAFLVNAWLSVATALVDGAAKAFGWVPGIGGKLKDAAEKFHAFKDDVNAQLNGVKNDVTVTATIKGGQKAIDEIADLRWQLDHIPKEVTVGVLNKSKNIPQRAAGGPVWPGEAFLVGEEGPELVAFGSRGMVYPAGRTAAMASGGTLSLDDSATELQMRAVNRTLADRLDRVIVLLGRQPTPAPLSVAV